jgi:hypothetical protein
MSSFSPAVSSGHTWSPPARGNAGESRNADAALKQQERDELDRIVARTGEVGELLSGLGSDDVDRALAVICAARLQLDQTERQLVRLAIQAGRSWARIGAALGFGNGRATHERFAARGTHRNLGSIR